jgi:hypothetical protein
MSNLFDLAPLLGQGSSIRRAQIVSFSDQGLVQVMPQGAAQPLECEVLNPDSSNLILSHGDQVLVWSTDAQPAGAVSAVVIETQGDLILRNGQSRIKLGAQGDIEIVCTSFVTRSQRLLRLLAPFIKLN